MKTNRALALLGAVAVLGLTGAVFTVGNAQETKTETHKFLGTDACKMCHKNIYESWQGTAHAKATEVLPAESKENGTCLGCHSTGYGKAGGYDPAAEKNTGLAGVGCEDCHGAAGDYKLVHMKDVEKAQANGMVPKPDAATCKGCHAGKVPEGHIALPAFDFAKAYPKIEHHLPEKK